MKLNQRQRKFAINYFETGNATQSAIDAGYSIKGVEVTGSNLLRNTKVSTYLEELNSKLEDPAIANVQERKKILSEIARGKLSNFIEAGQDGAWINIDRSKMNTSALQAIDSTTIYGKDGADPAVVTKIRLHNPITAIGELNKMEKVYTEGVTIDNRTLNINVNSDKAKDLTERLIEGEGTE